MLLQLQGLAKRTEGFLRRPRSNCASLGMGENKSHKSGT